MRRRSKRYIEIAQKVDRSKYYKLEEAILLLKELSKIKFNETVEVALRLGVNPRHADQVVRGTVVLPHGIGKSKTVLVFAKGEKLLEAKEAGAEFYGGDEYIDKIKNEGWLDFEATVATPDMMGKVGKLGRVLGPRGLMPNPKLGTVTFDVANAIKEIKAGKIQYRVEKAGIVHCPIGKTQFPIEKLVDNAYVLFDAVIKAKPATAKGKYIKNVSITSTMGPGIKIDLADVTNQPK